MAFARSCGEKLVQKILNEKSWSNIYNLIKLILRSHELCRIMFYYIVESEILRNTQWHIFHISTTEDIDHVTFSIYTIFCLGLYNKQYITRWLEDMTFIFSC
jgi:hypothetical protein